MQKIETTGIAYRNFENAIHSKATLRVYRRNLFEFFLFTKAKSLDQIIKYPTPKIQQILKDFGTKDGMLVKLDSSADLESAFDSRWLQGTSV